MAINCVDTKGQLLENDNACTKCGSKIQSNHYFCPYCGSQQPADVEGENQPVQATENTNINNNQQHIDFLQQLISMGFRKDKALMALSQSNYDINIAAQHLVIDQEYDEKDTATVSSRQYDEKEAKQQKQDAKCNYHIDLNIDYKFPHRTVYVYELIDILDHNENVWAFDDTFQPPPDITLSYIYDVKTSTLSNIFGDDNSVGHICKYGVPISRSITTVNTKRSPLNIFVDFISDPHIISKFVTCKNELQIRHQFANKHERIIQFQVATDTGRILDSIRPSDRDWFVYETIALLDEKNKILNPDVYLEDIESKRLYCDNHVPLRPKILWLMRSILPNNKLYKKGKNIRDHERGTFYRTGMLIEYETNSRIKITCIFEFSIGGSKYARQYFNKNIHSMKNALSLAERAKAQLH